MKKGQHIITNSSCLLFVILLNKCYHLSFFSNEIRDFLNLCLLNNVEHFMLYIHYGFKLGYLIKQKIVQVHPMVKKCYLNIAIIVTVILSGEVA